MKRLFVIFALILCTSAASRRLREVSEVPDNIRKTLDRAVGTQDRFNRTLLNFCPTIYEGFDDKLTEMIVCIDQLTLDRNETVCKALESKVPACYDGIVEFLEGCLKGDGKTLPRFVRDVITSIMRYACESTGEQLLELGNPCIYNETEAYSNITNTLSGELEKYKSQDSLPSKNYLCRLFLELRSEERAHIESACELEITRNAVFRFNDAVIAACGDSGENEV